MKFVRRIINNLRGSRRVRLRPDETIYVIGKTGQFEEMDYWIDPKLARQERRQRLASRLYNLLPPACRRSYEKVTEPARRRRYYEAEAERLSAWRDHQRKLDDQFDD